MTDTNSSNKYKPPQPENNQTQQQKSPNYRPERFVVGDSKPQKYSKTT